MCVLFNFTPSVFKLILLLSYIVVIPEPHKRAVNVTAAERGEEKSASSLFSVASFTSSRLRGENISSEGRIYLFL